MEHLRALFHDELDADGEVEIANQTFTRHDILSDMAADAYEVVFNDWVLLRRGTMMDKAESILADYNNEDRFDQLKLGVRREAVRPFVGAGMSSATGFPLWTSFLYRLHKDSHVDIDDLKAHINKGEYEEAAQLLYDDLGGALFDERVEGTYNRDRDILGPVNFLPDVFPGSLVITTNFDLIIERLFAEGELLGIDKVISGKQIGEALRVAASGTRVLVKLHGSSENVSDRVLLKSEYDQAYASDGTAANFLKRLLFGQSLLFLGCSLSNDRTVQLMREHTESEGADTLPRHYAFLELRDPAERVDREKELALANIFPIWYPKDDHDESIEALLTALMDV